VLTYRWRRTEEGWGIGSNMSICRMRRNAEALFCSATEEHIAVGEASVWYLSSAEAVSAILRYQPEAKFIVMVRNPIDMAPTLNGEMLLSGLEYEHEFPIAWSLQEERRRGRRIRGSWARRRFLYGEICSLGTQLERLYKIVPSHRVLTIILDNICADPRREYLRALRFIGVPDDGRWTSRSTILRVPSDIPGSSG
jgi:hypothetical protein